jgi:putative membrane protein
VNRGFWTSLGTRWAFGWAVLAGLYTAGVLALGLDVDGLEFPVAEAVLAMGAGLLLGMRLNFAYDRWWEARKLWGTLVNVSRNLAVKISAFTKPDGAEANEAATGIAAFAFALKDHLRGGANLSEVPGFGDRTENPKHVPLWLVAQLYERIHTWRESGRLVPHEMRTIDDEGRVLLDICGACERIRNTPMPPSLAVLARIVTGLALIVLPTVLIPRLGWWSVAAAVGIAFFMIVVESTASVIEHPFGTDPNQLDLDRICTVIRDTTKEALLGPSPE